MFVAYLRVSTDRQFASGLGLEAQREAVERYAAQQSIPIGATFVEAESGALKFRPQLEAALAMCRKHKAKLLIAKIDRLARNVAFVSALMETGVEFVAVDAPFMNKLMIHILSAFAEHEREQISERTKAALAAAKARGVKLGTYGRTLADKNIADATRFAEGVREPLTSMLENGAGTLQVLADGLNADGYLTREGAKWGTVAVHRTLRRLGLPMPAQASQSTRGAA